MTDPGPATGPGTEPPRPRRTWPARLALGMAAGGIAAAAVAAVVLYPYLRDDWVLDGIVKAVALDWRDFGEARARERLQFELDRRQVGTWVADDACVLSRHDDGSREVRCAWTVDLGVPGAGRVLPLSFVSTARLTADGDLR